MHWHHNFKTQSWHYPSEHHKKGYGTDLFIDKLTSASAGMDIIRQQDGFWFIKDRLIIPNVKDVHETLFHLAHNCMGHFGTGKSLTSLKDSFYWLNMRHDLELAYIPSCTDCQRNKSITAKPIGPLHPLPIPDARGNSVTIDLIGPLPIDSGFDTIITAWTLISKLCHQNHHWQQNN